MRSLLDPDYIDVLVLVEALEMLECDGLDRIRLHGFAKHSEKTAEFPEGHINTSNLLCSLKLIIEDAVKYRSVISFYQERSKTDQI